MKRTVTALMCMAAAIMAIPQSALFEADAEESVKENVIYAQDFGAFGDDDEGDSEALQMALKTARYYDGQTRLIIPSGTYYLDSVLKIFSDTYIQCEEDTYFVRDNDDSYMFANGADGADLGYERSHDITIDGGVWDGNVHDSSRIKGLARIWNAKGITIKNAAFENCCGTHFVMLTGVSDAQVTNCTFSGFIPFTGTEEECMEQTGSATVSYKTNEALHLDFVAKNEDVGEKGTPPCNIKVTDCTFTDCAAGVGTHHIYDYMTGNNIEISRNTFEDISYACVDAASFRNFELSSNTAENCGSFLVAGDTEGYVSNNIVIAKDELSGRVYDYATCYSLNSVKLYGGSRMTISGNELISSSGSGILVSDGSFANITGNRIKYPAANGIYVCSDSKAAVSGNELVSCGTHGVNVKDNSQLDVFISNTVSSAGENGVVLTNSQIINSERNNISDCAKNGYYLKEGSAAAVSCDTVKNCRNHGFYVNDSSSLEMASGRLSGNAKHCFYINERSKADISGCTMTENGKYDLYVNNKSKGIVYKNNTSDSGITKIEAGCSAKISGSVKILTESDFTVKDGVYTGKKIKPEIISDFEKGVDYKVSYGENITTGKDAGTVKITGIGSCKGSVSYRFSIKPKKASVSSAVSKNSGEMKISWGKLAKVSGYQIQYSRNSDMSSAKTVEVRSSTLAKTIKSLSKGKKYYVRVRGFKNNSRGVVYGKWSSKAQIDIKK